MKNFKCWAIANIEMILIAPVLCGALLVMGKLIGSSGGGSNVTGEGFFLSILLILAFFTPTKSSKGDIGKLLLALGIILILLYNETTSVVVITCVSLILGIIIGSLISRYAYKNIDQVISLRMWYRNSDVDLFYITWKYILNRFIAVFVSFTFLILFILAMFL